ncbi:alpha/beta-hydrolase [Sordaria brevicollis]|uniref:Alpha/beta-hydrolase n=1 Tax=Sordaria brevicollis TaxID=83679 RepID=A0AAE0UBJ7_SORBR|nr:alpha/beta-hydrolase [Sordaria brevicollis]
MPPVVFVGLLVALYIWKCMMLVVFQNKIIYMPGFPPNSPWELIENYANHCGGIKWTDERTRAADGTDLAMAMTTVPMQKGKSPTDKQAAMAHVYVLYFQGNAASIPPRLPDLSWVLRNVSDSHNPDLAPLQISFICLSYRGYWTSRGRPSEPGLRLDAEAGVRWISQYHEQLYGSASDAPQPILLLWGQSIGCGVATNLAATGKIPENVPVRGLLLETPFLSVRTMLETLYPQKWLPYKRLWPFLRNHLDSWTNMETIANTAKEMGRPPPNIFILEAERDELVPPEHAERLLERCQDLGLPVERVKSPSAFHSDAIMRIEGKRLAARGVVQLTKQALSGIRDCRHLSHGGKQPHRSGEHVPHNSSYAAERAMDKHGSDQARGREETL